MNDSFKLNKAAALYDGAAYAEMLSLLGRAQHSIRLSFFLFVGPDADKMISILSNRREQGVTVRVLLDRSIGLEGLLPGIISECWRAYRRLRALGIDVCLSDARPLPDRPDKKSLWHHKYLVVDDQEAMLGGMNVGSLFRRYHDLMVHIIKPTASALGQQFDGDWRYALDSRLQRPHETPPLEDIPFPYQQGKQTAIRLLGTGVGRRSTEEALRLNLCRAEKSVCVAVCEMGCTCLLDELIACHKRGISVRVLLCPLRITPFLPAGILNAGAIRTLIQAGISVHLYCIGFDFIRMHQKVAIFDKKRAVTGSTNWTRSGFGWIGETDVEMHGGEVIEQLAAGFESDWQRSTPAMLPSLSGMFLHCLYEKMTQ